MRPLVFAAFGALLAACAEAPSRALPNPAAAEWETITLRSACQGTNPRYCRGHHGFRIDSAGHYTAGPGDSGQVARGLLSPDELRRLDDEVRRVARSFRQSTAVECRASEIAPGVSASIDVGLPRGAGFRAVEMGEQRGSTCYRGGRQNAEALELALAELLARYYPQPF